MLGCASFLGELWVGVSCVETGVIRKVFILWVYKLHQPPIMRKGDQEEEATAGDFSPNCDSLLFEAGALSACSLWVGED